ncbi:TRAP transporter small permease [Piscinibacter sakaiensis]|uniref:TRAP transporter small permease n=1 Tax=Piscinibacter sakaiensis TaxID=1547922 RepID=UPI003AB0076E
MDARQTVAYRIGSFLDGLVVAIAAIGLMAMMVHITLDVMAGLLLNSPLALTSTYVTQYYMIAVAFLPVVAAEFRGAHISADLFYRRMPPRVQLVVRILVLVIVLGVYLMLTTQAWQQAMTKFASSAFVHEHGTRVVVWPSYFMLPVGFGLSAVVIAGRLVLALMGVPEAQDEPAEHDIESEHAGV